MEATAKKRNPYAKYHTDEVITKTGIWYEDEDVRIKVTFAGTENNRYDKMLKLKLKPFETRIRNDNFPDKEFHKVLGEVYAATVVLAWESKKFETDENGNDVLDSNGDPKFSWVPGVFDEEGGIMTYSEESIIKGFALGQRLFSDVIKVATNFNLFRKGQKDDDIKN